MEADPPLVSRLLPLPFGRHTSLSAPAPPFPKRTCCSLYRCHVAHDITSWGNNILVSVVQLILTVCAHCILRILSWINHTITANISRTITYSYRSCLRLNFILYLFGWRSFFHRIQKATVSSHHFTQYSYIGIFNRFRTAKACLFLFSPLSHRYSHWFKYTAAYS